MEPAPNRPCFGSRAGSDVAAFNVGGRRFEVLSQLIESHPSTLLANLLDDISTDAAEPIYVEANPERFAHILDWYRHGEIHMASSCSLDALLRDARYFMLPDVVKINGVEYFTKRSDALSTQATFRRNMLAKWPTFHTYVESLLAEVDAHCGAAADASDLVQTPPTPPQLRQLHYEQLLVKRFTLTKELLEGAQVWVDTANVCNVQRLRLLIDELSNRGYRCTTGTHCGQTVLDVGVAAVGGSFGQHVTPVRIDGLTFKITPSGERSLLVSGTHQKY